jgi:ABC-type uncharacterized transport system substrate-binding protein
VHFAGTSDSLALKTPENYWLDYDKGELTFHFTLPLETPADPYSKQVQIDVYDPSFYVAFGFAKERPVKFASAPVQGCGIEIRLPDAKVPVLSENFFLQLGPNSNFGAQFAQTAIIKCAVQ